VVRNGADYARKRL